MNNPEPIDALTQSKLIYEAILEDIDSTYQHRFGGGIQSITQNSTTSFEVRLSQEGRVDIFTYTFDLSDGSLSILNKSERTESH